MTLPIHGAPGFPVGPMPNPAGIAPAGMRAPLAAPAAQSEFDLDVRIVESGSVIDDLLRLTDDNCGSTCESACTSCG